MSGEEKEVSIRTYMRNNIVSFEKDEDGQFVYWDSVFKYIPEKYHDERFYFIKQNVSKHEKMVHTILQKSFSLH